MKRFLIISILAICSLNIVAEEVEYPHQISINAGAISGFYLGAGWLIDVAESVNGYNGQLKYFGDYSLTYHYQLLDWMRIGFKGVYEGSGNRIYTEKLKDNPSAFQCGYHSTNWASLMVSVQFTYIHKDMVRLYSGVDLGLGAVMLADNYRDGYYYENEEGERFQHHLTSQFFPAFDITPIGVNVGRRIYGIAEVNFGTDALIKLGIGGRF